jgi:hypothetical protein
MNVSSWPEIASYFYATGVRCGHLVAAQSRKSSVRFISFFVFRAVPLTRQLLWRIGVANPFSDCRIVRIGEYGFGVAAILVQPKLHSEACIAGWLSWWNSAQSPDYFTATVDLLVIG